MSLFFIVVGVVGFGVFLDVFLVLKLFLVCGVVIFGCGCGSRFVGKVICFCCDWIGESLW